MRCSSSSSHLDADGLLAYNGTDEWSHGSTPRLSLVSRLPLPTSASMDCPISASSSWRSRAASRQRASTSWTTPHLAQLPATIRRPDQIHQELSPCSDARFSSRPVSYPSTRQRCGAEFNTTTVRTEVEAPSALPHSTVHSSTIWPDFPQTFSSICSTIRVPIPGDLCFDYCARPRQVT